MFEGIIIGFAVGFNVGFFMAKKQFKKQYGAIIEKSRNNSGEGTMFDLP